ncbi:T9SS type B sorting domain-containing protein [Tenacibaculum piscium]|uniref:T9SS type B sorting domain-containing protein n=2 Tax=Tenacibaculum piscium TaxID=1458515 RepID=UPI00187BB2B1|nr:T9SS type B sorting domain-containing protein [Tenacibaculum piscium]MBE7690325.1 T9SS type B sorting domain-containing protein [Tenacibaculum piscium]
MIKKILLLASLFFTLISFSQKIDASLEHLREGESVMMERTMPLPLGQRPSGFTQSDIDKSSAGMDLTLRGNMTFIGNNNLSVDVKKTRDFRELNKAFDLYRYPYILNNGSVYTGNETPNDSYDLDLYIYQNGNIRQDLGNGSAYMDYVDVDGSVDENGDGKDDTFSSSTSTLSLPNCSRVAYAGLYWAGVYPREFWLTDTTPIRSEDYDKIKFKYPSSTSYEDIEADEIIYNANEPYICFKDITTEVQNEANPNGLYTAANIRGTRQVDHYKGLGGASGWVMIVVYENDNETRKNISIFDGFANIHGEYTDSSGQLIPANEEEITFDGFKTIPSGPVKVELIMASLEGDKAIPGDNYQIKNAANNYVNVFNTISPQDNFFNGSISVFDTYLAGRNPASTNTLGFDIDHIKINNPNNSIIGNNKTSLDVKFTTDIDKYWPFLNAMSVEVVEPEIKLVKTAVDATNTPITSEVALGGEVYYNITFQNIGTDNAKNTVIVDELKTTVDFKDIPGNIEVSDSRITYTYEASTTLNGGGGKLTFTVPDDFVKINSTEHWIKIKVNATSDCSKLRDACANKVENQAVATYERDNSTLDASNPGYVPGYNTLTTASYAGLEPTCNLGVQGTTNFVIDTSNCKGSIQLLCGGDVELSAGAGFDSYEWINIVKPAIVLATTQNYKAIEAGTYQVTAIAPSGCTDRIETIEVIGDNLATNPLEPFADQILTSCTSNTEELAEIYLCGTGVSKTINLPFGASLATTVKWFKLDETKPCDPTKPTELPTTTSNCANIATGCSWDEIGTKTGRELSKEFSQKGQYKLEVLYDGQCPKTYYFNVFSGALNPIFNKKHIVCGANGSIIVNGVPSGYEYKLTAPSGNTIPVNGFQNSNEFKNLSEVGNYDITIKLKGSTLASCSFDYIVKIDEQALGLTVAPEFNAGCDGKAIITAQVNGTLPGDYIYTLLNSVGGVIETKAATPDRSVTFEVTNAGLYSVKVATTTTTCIETVTTRVIKPTPLTLTAVATKNITCTAGSSDGIITLAGANGVPNTTGDKYSYALLSINGVAVSPKTYFTDTTYNVVNGTEGDYIFEVTDNKNCTATATATISVEAPLQFTHKETQVNCNKKGAITVKITDTLGYALEYSLDNATWKTTGFFDGLDATTAATLYTVYIRATKGTYQCNYQIQNIAITETGGLSAGSAVATGLECRWGNTQSSPIGTIAFTAPTGGTAPFTYFYKLAADTNFTTVTSGTTASVPDAGIYNTKVEDKNGCSLALDTVTIDALPTEPNLSSEVLLCGTTGTVIIMPNDSSYKYSIDGTNFQKSNVFRDLSKKWHRFTVKYGKSCTRTIDVNVSGQPFSGSIMSQTDSDCSGSDNGTITINASGFQGGSYEYSIDGGTTWEETGDNPYRIVGLEAKEHHLKIREVIGTAPNQLTCKINLGKRIIGEPTELKLINTGVTTPATCTTGGTITVEASGGTPPYKFSIDGGASWQNANTSNQYVYANVAVSATKYQVMLLDSRKCDECGCTDNPFENGSFEDRYFRGYYPYIADESNFTGWETTAADNEMELWYKNNFEGVPSYDGSDNFVELNANTVGSLYQEFCTKPGDVINWSVAHRGRLGRDVATVKIGKSLASATIEKTMSDGKTWKEYSGAYTVPVGQTTTVISFDAVSTFTGDKSTGNFIDAVKIEIVRATCVLKDIEVTAAAAATHTATVTDSCTDPKIEITATGTAPYQFSVDNGATWKTSNNATFVFNTTNGLALPTTTAKDYQVKTKNGGGCESPVSTLTVYPKLTATVTPTPESCKKGFFTITDVKGGNITTTNYVYAVVLKDATPTTTDFKPINPSTKSGGLSAGDFDIYIRDNGGNTGFCELKIQRTITKTDNPIITNITATELDCKLNTTASISFEITEGKAPFSYTVHDGTSTIKTGSITGNADTISGLDAGKYKIIVTDDNNCTGEISKKIDALVSLTGGLAEGTDSNCEGDVDAIKAYDGTGTVPFTPGNGMPGTGKITFSGVTGGTASYTYYYKKDSDTDYTVVQGNEVSGLPLNGYNTYEDTTYNTKVVDAKGCSIPLDDVTIKKPKHTQDYEYTENCGDGTTVDVVLKPHDPSYIYVITGQPAQTGVDANKFYNIPARYYFNGQTTLTSINFTYAIYSAEGCMLFYKYVDSGFDNFNLFQAKIIEYNNLPVPVCAGEKTGSVKVEAFIKKNTGDELYPANFEYSLDDGANWTESVGNPYTITGLIIGDNKIKIRKNQLDLATGEEHCEIELNKKVVELPVIEIEATATPITCATSTSTITPKVKNNYFTALDYELLDSSGNSFPTKKTISSYTGPNSFTNIPVGKYKIVATWLGNGPETGALGCKSAPIDVEVEAPKDIKFTATPSVCHKGSDATITVDVTEGNKNYQFSIDDGLKQTPDATTPNKYTFENLSKGTYKVTVTDGFGCSETEDVIINPQLKVSATTTQQTCKDGILDITASGGKDTNYVYAVVSENTAVKDADFGVKPTTITAGTWDIYVRDNNGTGTLGTDYCQAKLTTNEVTKIPNPTIDTVTAIQPKCFGEKGTINVTVSGGTTDYTVTLTGLLGTTSVQPQTGNSLNYEFKDLVADTYTIKVTDVNTCASAEKTQEIKVPSVLKDGKAVSTDLACGVSGGSITFTNPTGGTPDPVTGNYTFYYKLTTDANFTPVLGNNTNTVTVTNLSAGDYLTKVVDSEGCSLDLNTVTNPITIKALPAVPTFDPTTITYNCDGTATIKVTPTVAPTPVTAYSYMLDKDKTTTNNTGEFTAVTPGSHTVSVDYGSNCSTDIIVEVKAGQSFTATASLVSHPKCKDGTDGKIKVVASFGSVAVTEFQYSIDGVSPTIWTTVNSNEVTIDTFGAGTHTIKVRPNATSTNCDVSLTTPELNNPSAVVVNPSTKILTKEITCNPNTGATITPSASGGNGAPYTYELLNSAKDSYSPNKKITSNTFTDLSEGTYYVVAKDKLGCPSKPFKVVIADKKDVEFTATASACHTGSDASIKVYNIKGNGTYSFALTGTATKTGNITGTSHTISNLSAGTYTVTVTDGFGCSKKSTDIIINAKITATLNTTQANCNNGSLIIANVAGASTTNYVYAVVTAGNPVPTTFTAITNPLTTVSLSKGNYDVYIRDNNGTGVYCEYKETKEITKIPDLTATAKTIIQPNCFGETGSLVFEISGGKTPTYVLNDGTNDITPAASSITVVGNTHTIADLSDGIYSIKVTDANNCTSEITDQTIEAPDKLAKDGEATPIHFTCKTVKGGIDFVNPKGGTGVYTFSYKLDTAPVTAFMPVVGNQQLGLDAGTYNIKVKDVNNCEITLNDVTINPLPAAPTLTESVAYNCDGKGTITVLPSNSAYTYTLDDTAKTSNATGIFADLDAGSYTVSVGYGSDCFTDIDVIVAANQEFTASITGQTNPVCKDETNGKIEVTASFPSVTPISFEYSTDGTTWKDANTNPFIIDGFNAGTPDIIHTIKVRPTNETSTACDVTLTKILSNPTAVVVSPLTKVTKEITCDPNTGATITLFAGGGNGTPYTYELFDGVTLKETTLAGVNTFTDVAVGNYTIKAKDSEGCESVAFPIEVKAKIDVSFDVKALCYDGSNGTINVTNILGNGKFKYTQNGGTTLNAIPAGATSFIITGLSPGVHKIKIIDERGCSLEKTITIYPELSATATPTNISCNAGKITITANGGDGNYQYTVTPSADTSISGNVITVKNAATYKVTVKDKNGGTNACSVFLSIPIKTITPVKITTTANQPQCNGNKGSIDGEITANTGQAPFTITLKDNLNTVIETLTNHTLPEFSFNNIPAGTGYKVEITDNLTCTDIKTFDLIELPSIVLNIEPVLPDNCTTDIANTGFNFNFGSLTLADYAPYTLQYTLDGDNGTGWTNMDTLTPSLSVAPHPTPGDNLYSIRNLAPGSQHTPAIRILNADGTVRCELKNGLFVMPYSVNGVKIAITVIAGDCTTGYTVTVEAIQGVGPFEFSLTPDPIKPSTVPGFLTWYDAEDPTLSATNTNDPGSNYRRKIFTNIIPEVEYDFYVRDKSTSCIAEAKDQAMTPASDFDVAITPIVTSQSCPGITNNGELSFKIEDTDGVLNGKELNWQLYDGLNDIPLTGINGTISNTQGYPFTLNSTIVPEPLLQGLSSGLYFIVIEDANNGTAPNVCKWGSKDVQIFKGTPFVGNLNKLKDITCASPGQIRIDGVTGGFGDYTYTVTGITNSSLTTPITIATGINTFDVLYADVKDKSLDVEVTITVTDKNQCSFELPKATLTVSQSPTINAVTVNSCGAVNTIDINTTGGSGDYQYSINGGTFTAPVSTADHTMNVVDGNQTLTVKDANGCIATATFNVYPDITFDIDNITVPDCNTSNNSADNATATITVNTGSGNYQYSLDGVLPAVDIIGTTVTFPTTLTPGNHTIKIIDKLNIACTLEKTFTVSEPIKPSFTHTFTDSKCATDNSGTITLISTEALTYTISPDPNSAGSITTNIFSALPPNTYTVTGKGTNGCTTEIKDIIITEFKAITVPTTAISVTEFACNTGTNTTNKAIVKVNKLPKFGGSGTYTGVKFEFTPNGGGAVETQAASSSFEFTTDNILGGKVDITVFDDKGCSGTTTTAIIEPFVPIADLLAKPTKAITCSANESIEVTFTGTATEIKVEQIPTIGTGYSQTKTPVSPATTEFANLPVGKYTITVKQATGCTYEIYHTVTAMTPYNILLSEKKDIACFNDKGSIKIDVDGYTGNYDYEIVTEVGASLSPTKTGTVTAGTGTSKEITGLEAGKYKVKITLTGSPNCSVNLSEVFEINQPAIELSVTATSTEISCIGGTSTITATGKDGWGNYEYQLEDKDNNVLVSYINNNEFTGLAPNDNTNIDDHYIVRVKDGNGCEKTTDIKIVNPTKVEFTVTKDDTVCDVSKLGEIKVEATGGTAPYTYTLTDDASTPNVKTETITDTDYTFTGLSKANYTVSVKDANLCDGTVTGSTNAVEIYDDIVFNEPTLVTGLKCKAGVFPNTNTEASYEINVSGGSGSFTYEIKKGTDVEIPAGTTLTNTTTFTTSVAGDYTITITDTDAAPNCTITRDFTVQESVKPKFTATPSDKICFGTSDGVITINETVKVEINPISYSINTSPVITLPNGELVFKNLPKGTYTITGTGSNGCTTKIENVEIKQTPKVTIATDAIKDIEYSCSPEIPTATIKVDKNELSGGSGNYNVAFVYDNGTPLDNTDDVTQAASSNFTFTTTNVLGGKVKIIVSDDQGCSSASEIKEIIIPDFTPIGDLKVTQKTPITCLANESIKVSFTGTINNITVTQTDVVTGGYVQNPATPLLTSPIEFTDLPTGNYTISVTDAVTGCEATTFHTVEAAPVYNAVITNPVNVSCKGGTGTAILNIKETGTTLPYTGAYDYEVLDELGVSFSPKKEKINVSGQETISNLKAGKYTVKITMKASPDCSPISKVFEIIEPTDDLSVTGTPTKVSCIGQEDGTITATATGGWKNYEYELEYSSDLGITYNTAKDASSNDINFANNGSNNIFKNLPAGIYKVSVRDALGCDVESAEVEVKNPIPVTFSLTENDTSCNNAIGGEITVTGSGGTGTYTYVLTDNTTPTAIERTQVGVTGSYTFTNLPAAVYTVSVTDTNNCVGTENPTNINPITINPDIEFSLKQTKNVDCSASPNGEVTVTLKNWSTNYKYKVEDSKGTAFLNIGNQIFFDVSSQIFTISIPAGNVNKETYKITIIDKDAIPTPSTCGISEEITIAPKLEPIFKATPSDKICNGTATGVITITEIFNGIKDIKYTISPAVGTLTSTQGNFNTTTSSFENLPEGTYTITAKGDNDCPATQNVTIGELDKVTIGANAIKDITYDCDLNKATITVDKNEISGGNGDVNKNYNVEFIFTPTGGIAGNPIFSNNFEFITSNTKGGKLEIIVSDEKGCASVTKEIKIPAFVPIAKDNIKITHTPTCENEKQSITVKLENLDASIITPIKVEIKKADGTGTPSLQNITGTPFEVTFDDLKVGKYEVSVTHPITKCVTTSQPYTVEAPVYNVLSSSVENTTCVGSATGSVVIDIQKGNSQEFYTGKYEYEVLDSVGNSLTPSPIKANVQPTTLTTNPLKILGLKAGSYVVKITDIDNATACSFTSAVFKIEDAPAGELKVTAEISSEITCTDDNNAIIKATAIGGWGATLYQLEYAVTKTGTYTIVKSFETNKYNNRFTNLKEGFYIVKAKDSHGCSASIVENNLDFLEIKNPEPVTFKTEMIANICDANKKSAIKVTAKGGSGTYIYTLKDKLGNEIESITKTDTEHIFENLSVNNNEDYTVSVNDVKGCIGTPETGSTAVVTIYPELQFYLTPDKLSCQSDGTTTESAVYKINVTGGSGSFSYSVVDKNDATNIVTFITGTNPPTFSISKAGSYSVTITDSTVASCNSITKDFIVDDKLVPNFKPQILVNNICFGSSTGEVLVKETSNGINPLEYSISTNPIITLPIGEFKFTGLSAGTYTITGKGTNGCIATEEDVTIVEKTKITIDIDKISVTQFACATGANQTNMATVTVTDAIKGGIVPGGVQNINRIVFVYDNGTPLDATDDIEQDENDFIFNIVNNNNDIKAGTVTITVYDAQNCSSATTTVPIDAFQKIGDAEIKIIQKLDCSNKETITVKANLDIANLEYTITGTAKSSNYTETKTVTLGTDFATFTGLEADSYTITIKNPDTGCVFTTGYVVKDAPTFNIKIGETRRTCFDATGIATATVTLDIETIIAAADYTGAYTYEVVDKTGTSLTAPIIGTGIGGTQNIISGLIAGTYKVKVTMTDSPECEVLSEEFTIESQPALTLENSIVTLISCNSNKGFLDLRADGGWGNYEYQLEKTKNNITTIEQAFGKNSKFDTLEEGSYTATVRDINNCEATLSFVLVKGIKLTAETKVNKNVCEGEQNASIEIINVTGGQIQDAGVTYSYILKYPTELGGLEVEQSSNIFDGLLAGNYQVRVIDNKYGCNTGNFENVKVTIEDPIKVEASANITKDITCDITTASVKVTAKGGKAPYEFSIDGITYNPSNTSTSTMYEFTGLTAGLQTFYVRDVEQCVTTTTATIGAYVALDATLNVVSGFITCKNDSNGVLSADVTGGFGTYEYQLLNEAETPITGDWQTSNTFGGLNIGTYKIKVKSTNRFGEVCETITTNKHTIKEPTVLIPDAKVTQHVTCAGGDTGIIQASATGGNGQYEYNIFTIPSNPEYPENKFIQNGEFTNLPAGTYYIMVKDVVGCISPDTDKAPIKVVIKEPNGLTMNLTKVVEQTCINDDTPTITVDVQGGTQPYYISINNVELPNPYSLNEIKLGASEGIKAGGVYLISVRGKDKGCSSVALPSVIKIVEPIDLQLTVDFEYTCESGNIIKAIVDDLYKDAVSFTLFNESGIAIATNTTGEFIDIEAGDGYSVTATNTASGCSESSMDVFDIQDIRALEMTIDDTEKNKIIANVDFGLPPYNFTLDGIDYGTDNEFTLLQTKDYEIKVTDARGCEVTLTVTGEYITITVLNLFTPDGDGINDFWYPLEVEGYHKIKVYIYDRYARKIANYQGQNQGWDGTYDGKPLPAGDYWYTIYYSELSGEQKKIMGHFTLYR